MDINGELIQWFISFSNNAVKSSAGSAVKSEIMLNQQLAEELHKPIIRNFKKRKVHSFV